MNMRSFNLIVFFWLFVNVGKTVAEELPRIDTSNYPALSAKQIGHVRHMVLRHWESCTRS